MLRVRRSIAGWDGFVISVIEKAVFAMYFFMMAFAHRTSIVDCVSYTKAVHVSQEA